MKLIPSSLIAALLAVAAPCFAHHGQDFLLIEDYQQSLPGQFFFISNFEWENSPMGNEFGFSPSLMFGVIPRLALSVDAEFRNEPEGDWRYNSVTPALHVQLSPTKSTFPVKFAISGGYQFADGASETEEEGEEHHHEEADHHDEHEHHEHAEESQRHHHGGSIHNHDADAFVGRFIAEADIGETKIVANLLSVVAEGDKAAWGYAVGARHKIVKELALGAEALGDFKSDGWQELVAGAYFEPSHLLTLKLGVGFGLTEETPDFTLRTGLTYRF
jgi:hypothetical protein